MLIDLYDSDITLETNLDNLELFVHLVSEEPLRQLIEGL